MRKYEEWVEIFNANVGVSPSELAHLYGVATSTIRHHQGRWRKAQLSVEPEPTTQRSVRATMLPMASTDTIPAASVGGESLWRVLFVPDCHIPYHDQTAWEVMLAAAQHFSPHIIVQLGDLVDFYQVSRHDKDPRRKLRLDDELTAARTALDRLDALGAPHKLYVMGNHEHRLEAYLRTRAPEMFGVIDVDELLGLTRRGWQWKPYREYGHVGHMLVTHDLSQCGVTAIRHARTHAGCAVAIGHVHRMGSHWTADVGAGALPSIGFGWLGSHRMADYRTRWLAEREWVHGFGIAHMGQDGVVHPQCIPIRNGSCCIEGTMVTV